MKCKYCGKEIEIKTKRDLKKQYCNKECSGHKPASEKQKEAMRKLWKNNKEKMSKEISNRYKNEEYKNKMSKAIKLGKTEDVKKRTVETLKKTITENPEILEKKSLSMKKRWDDPEFKEKQKKLINKGFKTQSDEKKLLHKENCKKSWTEERKKNQIKKSKKIAHDNWNNEEYINKIVNSKSRISSRGEKEVRIYFQEKFKNDKWTCGGQLLLIDGKRISRDCYSNKLKVMIEYDGIWHFKDIVGQLKDKQEKDKLLEEWAIKNNWKLIRIKEEVYKSNKQYWLEQLVKTSYDNSKKGIIKFY